MMLQRPDEGWAWMVLVGSSISNFINGMMVYSGGLLNTALQETYSDRIFQISLIVALSTSLFALAAPFVSIVVNMTSCRTCHLFGGFLLLAGLCLSCFVKDINVLLLTYGIMTGTGLSFCFIPSIVIIGYYFNKWSSLAFGIAMGAAGIGSFTSNLITPHLLDRYGLQGTFLLFGGVSAHSLVAALLMRPCKYETRQKENEVDTPMYGHLYKRISNAKHILVELCKNKSFMYHILSVGCFNISLATIVVHEATYSVHIHIASHEQSAFLIAAFSVSNTLGRFFIGCSTLPHGLDDTMVYIGQMAIVGVLHLLFPLFDDTFKGHMVFCILSGFYLGGLLTQYQPLAHKYVGVRMFASSTGPLFLLTGAGFLSGPAVVGLILENGGTYRQGYLFSGITILIGAMFALVSGTNSQSRPRDTMNQEDVTQMIVNKEDTGI